MIEPNQDMGLLESYSIKEDGFHPILIRDSWQVAKLNYSEEYDINNLHQLSKHQNTDRAFALLKGKATLIAMDLNGKLQLKTEVMTRGTSYKIPKNIDYAVVMEEESELLIVEKSNTHIVDVEYCPLSEEQLQSIKLSMNQEKEDFNG